MLAVFYLVVCMFTGYFIIRNFLGSLLDLNNSSSLAGNTVKIAKWFVVFPSAFLIGTLLITWSTYFFSYLYRYSERPLFFGNLIALGIFTAVCTVFMIKNKKTFKELNELKSSINSNQYEVLFSLSVLLITTFLMFYTFFIKNGKMYIGFTVFSDFAPHLSMIRSFSMASNIPTEYTFFADGTVRYHFMFQFLAGNLEYLGLRLDWAFNLISIFSFTSFVMLLYIFAVLVTGKQAVGLLACIFFFFRGSFSFFTYLSDVISNTESFGQMVGVILKNDAFIGKTQNESWGLWNQNVFLNQRHFAFSLGILMLILIVMLPSFKNMMHSLSQINEYTAIHALKDRIILKLKVLFWNKEAWCVESFARPITIGVTLGLISFWNGAVVFATLPVLFFLAIMSKRKLEYFIIAVITVILSLIESRIFIGAGASAVEPKLTIGFLAQKHTLMGIIAYYVELLGVLPIIVIASMFALPKGLKWISLSFTMPFIMANILQLTPDIAVNHKYVMISVLLLDIIAADFVIHMYRISATRVNSIAIAAVLIFFMTATGVVDLITIYNANSLSNVNGKRPFILNTNDKLTKWVVENTPPNEVFLTDTYFIHPFMLSGRKIFLGWQYFAWSAGYDTKSRDAIAQSIFNSQSKAELKSLVSTNNISYILIDNGLRSSKVYKVNEELIKDSFELVYNDKESNTVIYKTH